MRLLVQSVLLSFILYAPLPAANLIVNGDFENTSSSNPVNGLINGRPLNGLAPANGWDVYTSIPSWATTPNFIGGADCTPCTPAGIEVQHNTIVTAHSGFHFIELDSHRADGGGGANSAMSQALYLTAGDYELSYWYHARTSAPGDNGIKVFAATSVTPGASDEIPLLFGNDVAGGGWAHLAATLSLPAGTWYLTFAAVGPDNSYGGFIDDVNLEELLPPQEAPEPATFGALALGLAVLLARKIRTA